VIHPDSGITVQRGQTTREQPMSTLENLKEIADLVKKLGDIELYRKIVELEGEVIELTRESRRLDDENRKLKGKLEFTAKMNFAVPFWYAEGDHIPYCPECWEAGRIAVHLLYKGNMAGGHRYDCPHCENVFCSLATPAPRL
jgi:hypothetical protein